MERDEWEARAFVQEKGALTEPGQQPGNLGNWLRVLVLCKVCRHLGTVCLQHSFIRIRQ